VVDVDYFNMTRHAIMARREQLSQQLLELGFSMTDSKANFVFVEHHSSSAADIALALRQRGIIVRHLSSHPLTVNRLRISIGTQAECDALIAA